MQPTTQSIGRLRTKLRLETPLIAVYDAAPSATFEPTVKGTSNNCCFTYYPRWLKGETLVIQKDEGTFANPTCGCPGAQRALGFVKKYPPFMANYLTDGKDAPTGEGLKASPELAQEFLDRLVPTNPANDTILLGPLRPDQWDVVRSVTFFVDPDRLAGVMTLATYWSSDPDLIQAPFSSSCGMIWRALGESDRDRAILGATDLAMRRYLPPEILSLTVSPARFEQMLTVPDGSFLDGAWWNDLLDQREKERK
jgi:hypothetical protein